MSYTCSLSSCPFRFLLSKWGPHRVVTSAHGSLSVEAWHPKTTCRLGHQGGNSLHLWGAVDVKFWTGRDNGQIPQKIDKAKQELTNGGMALLNCCPLSSLFFSHALSILTVPGRTPESSTKVRVVIVVYEIQLDSHPEVLSFGQSKNTLTRTAWTHHHSVMVAKQNELKTVESWTKK